MPKDKPGDGESGAIARTPKSWTTSRLVVVVDVVVVVVVMVVVVVVVVNVVG